MTTEMNESQIDNSIAYKSWSSSNAVEWIISIDSSKFEKYREALNNSFQEKNIDIESIVDQEDLKQYGIIDLDDRKTIYTSITQLITSQKGESQDCQTLDTQNNEIATSLLSASDDEEDEADRDYSQSTHSSLFSEAEDEKEANQTIEDDYNLELQRQNLMDNGYCKWMSDKSYKAIMINLTSGYIRNNYHPDHDFPLKLNDDVLCMIRKFYGIIFGIGDHVKLQLGPERYLTTITNISLSTVLTARLEASESNVIIVEEKKVPCDTFEHILMYLGHHKGVEPDKLPCPVRSIHMRQICSDQWDADYIDGFDKKTIFEIILAAHHLNITCLVHLGSAKIATLIKQLDQKEINRIIEEEEKYRREHAAANNSTNNTDDDEEESKQVDNRDDQKHSISSMNPAIEVIDQLLSIFDHNEDDEARIQGIGDEKDKVHINDTQNNEETQ